MCVTRCSPRMRTSPRVIVVLPAAESPTTPRMIGRGTSGRLLEDGRATEVLGLERGQALTAERPALAQQPRRLTQACSVDGVPHRPRVRELLLCPAQRDVLAQCSLGLLADGVGLLLRLQQRDGEQLIVGVG